jgi:hypothetical protein
MINSAAEIPFLVHVGRNATTVVYHGDRFIRVQDDLDLIAMTGQGLIDGVVDQLEHHMVQTRAIVGVTDVHPGTLAYGIQPLQHLDALGSVFGIDHAVRGSTIIFLSWAC